MPATALSTSLSPDYLRGMEYLLEVVQKLSLAESREDVIGITRHAARELTGADGATFILREGDLCSYVDEDAIEPLWKGRRFPMVNCVSGWAMMNKATAVIEDIYADPRVPVEAYRPTFVKSMAMVPIRKDAPIGAIGNYWATTRPIGDEQVKLLEALANAVAIALENVRLVADLKKANESLERALEMREEFITVASHELRTPLTSLMLQLELMKRSCAPEAKHLGLALSQGTVLTDLIEKLLDLSRIRQGKFDLDLAPLDLSAHLTDSVERFRSQLSKARCELVLDVEAGVRTECDRGRLEQVISTLLSNAVKYAPGHRVTVSLRAPEHGIISLAVADEGTGIAPAIQQKIFTAFERGVNSRHVSGLGLGLYVARSLVEAHGGRIRVESAEGKGSTFIVELPCRAKAD